MKHRRAWVHVLAVGAVASACSAVPDVTYDGDDGGMDAGGVDAVAPHDAAVEPPVDAGVCATLKAGETCCRAKPPLFGESVCFGGECNTGSTCEACGQYCAGHRCCPHDNKCVALGTKCPSEK